MKPKLLIITNRLVIGGISNDIISAAHYLQKDFDIVILYGEKQDDEEEALHLLAEYKDVQTQKVIGLKKSFKPFADITSYRKIKEQIKSFNPDIVHTHGSKSGFLGRLAAHFCHVPCIVHTFHGHLFHSYYNPFFSWGIKITERLIGNITSKIIALSNVQFDELTKKYRIVEPEKCAVVSLGIDVNKYIYNEEISRQNFREKYKLAANTIAIGSLGRIVPVKNNQLFIDIIIRVLSTTNFDVRFFLIGDGHVKKQLQQQLSHANIKWCEEDFDCSAKVIFTSWISNIEEPLNGIDIFVLTSVNEGTPISLIEAQVCGKPVIASDVGGVKDTFADNETGFLIADHSVDAFAEKLELLIKDAALRKLMGEKAKSFAKQKFAKQQEVDALKKLYQQCLRSAHVLPTVEVSDTSKAS